MDKKTHNNQNAFTVLKFSIFAIYLTKNCVLNVWKGQIYMSPSRIWSQDLRYVVNALTHCALMLGKNYEKEFKKNKIKLNCLL